MHRSYMEKRPVPQSVFELTVSPDEYQGPGARNFSNDRQKVWNCSSNTAGKAGFFCCDPFDQDTAGNCCPGKGNINIFSIGKDGVQVQSLPPSTLSSTRSSTSSSSVSTTSTTGIGAPRTAITAVTSTSSPSSSSGSSLSSGAKVGLGVGVPLGVIAIAAVAAAAFFLRRSRRTLESPMIQDHGHQVTVTSTYGNRESYPSPSPQEEQSLGTNTTHELPVRERHELPVGERHELPVGERHELPVGERQQLPENTLHDLPNAQAK
ncbi:MAG: hypothetical protein M1814_001108 [Vezdaea aestivalis]|nr:MAG: hypothetical protein M1814_001108 [Vezdaea aestivalis]